MARAVGAAGGITGWVVGGPEGGGGVLGLTAGGAVVGAGGGVGFGATGGEGSVAFSVSLSWASVIFPDTGGLIMLRE